ncbi:MAG: peptidoglycan-binding protein [Alphaproteobacteria bacterium]|nr:peptidoglycan-binding protein [Alphaproteobacteria bacterium]
MTPQASTIIAFILKHEGGYVNDPHDAGGETNFGISKRQYPNLDIKNLTKQQAAEIYQRDYYAMVKGDSLPAWLALLLTDFGVNAGTGTAARLLQRILGQAVDGILGKNSLAAVQMALSNPNNQLRQDYVAGRRAHYQNLVAQKPSQQKFLKGWLNRTNECAALAEQWALQPPV